MISKILHIFTIEQRFAPLILYVDAQESSDLQLLVFGYVSLQIS